MSYSSNISMCWFEFTRNIIITEFKTIASILNVRIEQFLLIKLVYSLIQILYSMDISFQQCETDYAVDWNSVDFVVLELICSTHLPAESKNLIKK